MAGIAGWGSLARRQYMWPQPWRRLEQLLQDVCNWTPVVPGLGFDVLRLTLETLAIEHATVYNHFSIFSRRPPKKSKDYNVSILLGREKLRDGIPLWLKAFEFASPRISNVWILLELRGCWPWSCANSSICYAASSICYPAAQAAAPFLRPCAAPTGLNAMNGLVRRGRGCSNPSFGDLKWIQGLKMFIDDVSPQVSPKVFS